MKTYYVTIHHACVGLNLCLSSHEQGVLVVNSKAKAWRLWRLKHVLPACPCKGLLETKGVYMGWKQGNESKIMSLFMKEYLLKYSRKEGLLNNNTKQFFHMDTEKMSFVVFNGIGYKVGDLVVLRTDDMEGNVFSSFGDWTWKAKITSIFMQ